LVASSSSLLSAREEAAMATREGEPSRASTPMCASLRTTQREPKAWASRVKAHSYCEPGPPCAGTCSWISSSAPSALASSPRNSRRRAAPTWIVGPPGRRHAATMMSSSASSSLSAQALRQATVAHAALAVQRRAAASPGSARRRRRRHTSRGRRAASGSRSAVRGCHPSRSQPEGLLPAGARSSATPERGLARPFPRRTKTVDRPRLVRRRFRARVALSQTRRER
jgi:hypothetical protein